MCGGNLKFQGKRKGDNILNVVAREVIWGKILNFKEKTRETKRKVIYFIAEYVTKERD